jgi:magnesium transporter
MRAWRYVHGVDTSEPVDLDHLGAAIDPARALVWIDTDQPSEEDRVRVQHQLGLSSRVVEAFATDQPERTKLLRYGDYFHVAVHDCELRPDSFESREIDIVAGPGWIVTVRHPTEHSRPFDIHEVMRRFELQRTEHKSFPEDGFLLYAIFDVVIDRYFDVTDAIDDRLDDVERDVFGTPHDKGIPAGVFALRRDLVDFRRAAAPMREVVDAIARKELPFVCDDALVHFRDLYDRLLRVIDLIESQRDLLTGLLEADLAVVSNQLNEVMKKVTSWGAILVVGTLITGIYGMNFHDMPELSWSFGYPVALTTIVAVMFGLWVMFKRKNWL